MASIEDLREQLEQLKLIDEKAYVAALKNLKAQKQIKAQYDLGQISLKIYNEAIEENNRGLNENTKEIIANMEALHKQTKAKQAASKAYDMLKGAIDKTTSTIDLLTGAQTNSLKGFTEQIVAIRDLAFRIQGLSVDIRRQTGFANKHTKTFMSLRRSFLEVGLTSDQVAESIVGLSQNFSAFDSLTEKNRSSLVELSKDFKLLGVDFDTFADAQERIRFSFGLTAEAATNATRRMEDIANVVGRPVQMVLKDLSDIGPELARFGSRGIDVFEGLARRARRLGLSVKEAFDVSELFDTFEGAANIAGRLNAQLGLQLNSVELMKASSEERIDILRTEFQLQGKSFDAMGRRQRQMIAGILGTDIEQAGKLLGDGMDIAAFRAEKSPQELLIKSQDKVAGQMELLVEALSEKNPITAAMGGLQGVIKKQAQAITALGEKLPAVATGLAGAATTTGTIDGVLSAIGVAGDIGMVLSGIRGMRGGPGGGGKGRIGKLLAGAKGGIGKAFGGVKDFLFGKKGKYPILGDKGTPGLFGRIGGFFKGAGGKIAGTVGKIGAKKLPFGIGALLSLPGIAKTAMSGNVGKAGLMGLSALLSAVPLYGTAASLAIDGGMAASDAGAFSSSASAPAMSSGMMSSRSRSSNIKATINQTIMLDGKVITKKTLQDVNMSLAPTRP